MTVRFGSISAGRDSYYHLLSDEHDQARKAPLE